MDLFRILSNFLSASLEIIMQLFYSIDCMDVTASVEKSLFCIK